LQNAQRAVTAKSLAAGASGEVPRGYLGIGLEEIPGEQAKTLGLVDHGAVAITFIQPGQPADQAGLRVGDVISRFNNDDLASGQAVRHFRRLIVDTDPGGEVSLDVYRGGHKEHYQVKVGKRPVNLP
jgi:serine protease Do